MSQADVKKGDVIVVDASTMFENKSSASLQNMRYD